MPARKKDRRQDVGLKLREAREARGITLQEVEPAIKIHAQHLEALEAGDYEALPNVSWRRGFLVTYATYLRLDGEQLAEDLFPARHSPRALLYLGRRWRALLAILSALVVALALMLAALAASYEPFADAFTGRVDDLLQRLAPGIVPGYETQPPSGVDVVLVNTAWSLGGTQALQTIDHVTRRRR